MTARRAKLDAAIADARTNILTDQPGTGEPVRIAGTGEPVRIAGTGARVTYTFLAVAVPGLALLGSAPVPITIGLGVLGAWGIMRAWRIVLLADRDFLTVRNFLWTYRVAWHDVAEFSDGSTYAGAESAWALRISLKDGRVIPAHATAARPSTAATLIKIARQHNILESLTGRQPKGGWPRTDRRFLEP